MSPSRNPDQLELPAALVAALSEARGAPLLVALDFDGTLSLIVPHPAQARPVAGALPVLARLAGSPGVTVALVSGRPVADLREVSGVTESVLLIGSHGAEWGGRDHKRLSDRQAETLRQVRTEVAAMVDATPGAMIEPKPAGFAIHVRQAEPTAGAELHAAVQALARAADLHVLAGKSVLDVGVHPLDKGAAVMELRHRLGDPTVLFAGDDVTDETVMTAAQSTDITIRVGPGETSARFRVPDPHALVTALEYVVESRATLAP